MNSHPPYYLYPCFSLLSPHAKWYLDGENLLISMLRNVLQNEQKSVYGQNEK